MFKEKGEESYKKGRNALKTVIRKLEEGTRGKICDETNIQRGEKDSPGRAVTATRGGGSQGPV